jgi:hypothetical protein
MIRPPADWLKRRSRQAERVIARAFEKEDRRRGRVRDLPKTTGRLERDEPKREPTP